MKEWLDPDYWAFMDVEAEHVGGWQPGDPWNRELELPVVPWIGDDVDYTGNYYAMKADYFRPHSHYD